jgi:hypothetical protein
MPENTTEDPKTEVEKPVSVAGKVGWGLNELKNPTPIWAKWLFRIFFYVTSTTTIGLHMFSTIKPETMVKWDGIVSFANLALHGATKLFGVKEDFDYYPSHPGKV